MNSQNIANAYQACIRYLAPRARSVHEIRQYLKKKGFNEHDIEQTTAKLEQENLLNDKDFATMFVEQRERFKPRSKLALSFELKQKGISADIIDACMVNIDEYASAWSAIQPKLKLWKNYDDEKLKKKVMNYLNYRGFNYAICISTFSRILNLAVAE